VGADGGRCVVCVCCDGREEEEEEGGYSARAKTSPTQSHRRGTRQTKQDLRNNAISYRLYGAVQFKRGHFWDSADSSVWTDAVGIARHTCDKAAPKEVS
jgi:hypothetical protein